MCDQLFWQCLRRRLACQGVLEGRRQARPALPELALEGDGPAIRLEGSDVGRVNGLNWAQNARRQRLDAESPP